MSIRWHRCCSADTCPCVSVPWRRMRRRSPSAPIRNLNHRAGVRRNPERQNAKPASVVRRPTADGGAPAGELEFGEIMSRLSGFWRIVLSLSLIAAASTGVDSAQAATGLRLSSPDGGEVRALVIGIDGYQH